MARHTARITFLRLIGEHDGEWTWYQFERAFPPGWFSDEPPATRAGDILKQLETDDLVTITSGVSLPKYRLTENGRNMLRLAAIGSVST